MAYRRGKTSGYLQKTFGHFRLGVSFKSVGVALQSGKISGYLYSDDDELMLNVLRCHLTY